MPITAPATIKHTLEEVAIHLGGSVTVVIKTEVTGMPHALHSYEITREEAGPIWMSPATAGLNRWADLCGLLYELLIARGDLVGDIS